MFFSGKNQGAIYPHVVLVESCGFNKAKPKTKEKEEKAEKKATAIFSYQSDQSCLAKSS